MVEPAQAWQRNQIGTGGRLWLDRPSVRCVQPGWMLLSYGKTAKASSNLDGHPPEDAFDEDVRTYWSARTANPGEWLSVIWGRSAVSKPSR